MMIQFHKIQDARSHSAVQPSGAPLKLSNRSDALSDVLLIGAALLISIGAVSAVCLYLLFVGF